MTDSCINVNTQYITALYILKLFYVDQGVIGQALLGTGLYFFEKGWFRTHTNVHLAYRERIQKDLPADACPVVLEHTSYVPSGTTPTRHVVMFLVLQRSSAVQAGTRASVSITHKRL